MNPGGIRNNPCEPVKAGGTKNEAAKESAWHVLLASICPATSRHGSRSRTFSASATLARCKILGKANVDAFKKVQDLGEEEVNRIRQVIEDEGDVEGDLRKDVSMHIKRLIDIQSYRGHRHRAVSAGARPAHPHQRPHPQGSAQGHRRQQEESDGEDLMAKPEKAAAGKAGKNKKFKKRERKNVPLWYLVHIQASFNNTIVTITDQVGNTLSLEELRFARLPRFAQGHALRGAAGCVERRQPWLAITVCARSMCASPVRVRAASPPSAHWPPPASKFAPSATSRRFRTTAAVRRSGAESKKQYLPASSSSSIRQVPAL